MSALKLVPPEAPNGARPPPAHLSPESAELWREVVTAYCFGIEGYPLLETALEARDRARQAREEVDRGGMMFVSETGTPHMHPLLRVERDALREFRLTWGQLQLDLSPPEE